jgi:prepilin-type N-terminal cleavage/methylation domain-containing protein
MKTKNNTKGFTLIELLVVVAIIAILAGIVLVSLSNARVKADRASLQSTLASIMPIASMCVNDGGTIQTATPGSAICDLSDITETWPTLPTALSNKGYSYLYNATGGSDGGPAVIGTGPGGYTITCTVSTGSCQ